MSLINNLINPSKLGPGSNIYQGGSETFSSAGTAVATFSGPADPTSASGHMVKKYTVTLADIQALGAFTTGDIILDVLPAGSIITTSRIRHNTSVAGAAGPITAATARLMFGATALGAAAIDVYAATSTTDSTSVTGLTNVISPSALNATTNLVMRITQTGATTGLSDATAGSIDAWIDYKVLL